MKNTPPERTRIDLGRAGRSAALMAHPPIPWNPDGPVTYTLSMSSLEQNVTFHFSRDEVIALRDLLTEVHTLEARKGDDDVKA